MSNPIKTFFDEKAEHWDLIVRNNPEMIDAILTITGPLTGRKVLDIACGTGVLFSPILERTPLAYHAIDISDKMIEKAKAKPISQGITLSAVDIMDYSETDFDYAIVFNAYPHFLEVEALAQKLSEVLRSGGRFVIAHDHSRSVINGRHHGQPGLKLARHLMSVQQECTPFKSYFTLDMLIDTDNFYLISGIKE